MGARELLPVLRMLRPRPRRLVDNLLLQPHRPPRALRGSVRRALHRRRARAGAGIDGTLRGLDLRLEIGRHRRGLGHLARVACVLVGKFRLPG